MTTDNQQGMTDETIKQQAWERTVLTNGQIKRCDSERAACIKQAQQSYAAGVASQEAEIKRLTNKGMEVTNYAGGLLIEIHDLEKKIERLKADSQVCVEGIFRDIKYWLICPSCGSCAIREGDRLVCTSCGNKQSLKKRVRGDGT